eukprot:COSAG02_NODE_7744_length_2865_cov_2.134490_2_plen_30_part_01
MRIMRTTTFAANLGVACTPNTQGCISALRD